MAERSAPTHPDGDREFELVLGNKQLFSLLFIMFILLGIFFAMGYTLGRTSAPPDTATAAGSNTPAQAPSRPVQRPSAIPGAPPESKTADAEKGADVEQTAAPNNDSKRPSAGELPGTAFIDPKPGETFMQVSAVARPEAELLVEVLTNKGFRAAMAPGPSDKLFRVLVGPAATDADLAKLKTDLERSGFRPIPRRY
jgi:cell division septation protein DedD